MESKNEMPPLPKAEGSKVAAPSIMNNPPPVVEPPKEEVKPVEVVGTPNQEPALSNSQVKIEPPKAGIEVQAISIGFFAQGRREAGERFMIPNRDKLGKWMRCLDPKEQKLHEEAMKKKKSEHRDKIVGG